MNADGGGGAGGLKIPGAMGGRLGGKSSVSTVRDDTSELSGRKKVMLAPGHSLMDWIRLGRAQGDLSGVSVKRRDLTLADLAVHNRPDDIWMALRGKVYNITPYMNYHPGGVDELMRAAGKDGTQLFDEIHNWVNLESMLEKCLVGYLSTRSTTGSVRESKPRKPSLTPVSPAPPPPSIACPTQDWYQKADQVTVVIYTKLENLRRENVTVEILPGEVCVQVFLKEYCYSSHFKPSGPIKDIPTVTVTKGKVEVRLEKAEKNKQWAGLGELLSRHEEYSRTKNHAPRYRKWVVTSNTHVTHNTVLLRLKAPKGYTMIAPIGYHIHIITDISGMQIGRSYTVISPSITNPKSDKEQEEGRAIHLMIKRYPGGALTPWVTGVKPGDGIMVSNYDGNFEVERLNKITHLVLFAAGTGFTTMVRIISFALDEMPKATFQIKLVFYNKTQEDILWRDQLAKLAADKPRFSVVHVLSQEPEGSTWKGPRGRVSSQHVEDYVPAPSLDSNPLLCICGQWAYNDSVESLAKLHGLKEEHIIVFAQH